MLLDPSGHAAILSGIDEGHGAQDVIEQLTGKIVALLTFQVQS